MKLCKDCRWYSSYTCASPKLGYTLDLVDGTKYPRRGSNCCTQREAMFLADLIFNKCGKRARWFEPREKV